MPFVAAGVIDEADLAPMFNRLSQVPDAKARVLLLNSAAGVKPEYKEVGPNASLVQVMPGAEPETLIQGAPDPRIAQQEETARHNKEMERIAGLTAGRADAAATETARHNKAMEGIQQQAATGANQRRWATNPATGKVELMTDAEIRQAGAGQPPTADMRNKVAGRELVAKSITAIKGISDRIITRVGPAQRADAIKRGVEAVFGSDPDFRTYQDARRSLAGNLAVAQQGSRPSDADVEAIWLPLVPDPYRDTSESAALKWELIRTMSNVPPSEGGGGAKKIRARDEKGVLHEADAGTALPQGWTPEP